MIAMNKMVPVSSDHQERARVRSCIGSLILEFCRLTLNLQNKTFHMEELWRFVERAASWEPFLGHIAPDSPGRIFRLLQQQGKLGYRVVDRTQSLYEILWVGKKPAEQTQLFARAS